MKLTELQLSQVDAQIKRLIRTMNMDLVLRKLNI